MKSKNGLEIVRRFGKWIERGVVQEIVDANSCTILRGNGKTIHAGLSGTRDLRSGEYVLLHWDHDIPGAGGPVPYLAHDV